MTCPRKRAAPGGLRRPRSPSRRDDDGMATGMWTTDAAMRRAAVRRQSSARSRFPEIIPTDASFSRSFHAATMSSMAPVDGSVA